VIGYVPEDATDVTLGDALTDLLDDITEAAQQLEVIVGALTVLG
jgi:hypothetical protein